MAGTTNRVKTVPMTMPLTSMMPMLLRAPAPGPLARTRGKWPATVFGHMPLVLVTGAGAEARNSIGIMLVSGMAIGTVFTLFILPAVYMLFAAEHRADRTAADARGLPGWQAAA